MSRYVTVALERASLRELVDALEALGLAVERDPGAQVMLEGTLECAGEPVDVRIAPGPFDTVEDFGFLVSDEGDVRLVCGDVDRRRLELSLRPALLQQVAEHRAVAHARATGAEVEIIREADGTRRIKLRRS